MIWLLHRVCDKLILLEPNSWSIQRACLIRSHWSLAGRSSDSREIRIVHLTQAPWLFLPFSRYNQPANLRWSELFLPTLPDPLFPSLEIRSIKFDLSGPSKPDSIHTALNYTICAPRTKTRQNIHLTQGTTHLTSNYSNSCMNLLNH